MGTRRDLLIVGLVKVLTVLGVSNHIYDPAKQQLTYSPGAFVYRFCLHLGCLLVIVFNSSQLLSIVIQVTGAKAFLVKLSITCLTVNVVTIASAIFSEYWGHGKGTQPFNELLGIRIEGVVCPEELVRIRRHAWMLLSVKSGLAVLFMLMSVLAISTQCQANFTDIVSAVCLNLTQLEFISAHYQFNVVMIYEGYLFNLLNLRLSQVVKDLNRGLYVSRKKTLRIKEELTTLGQMHTRLWRLVHSFADVYQLHMLALLLAALFFQVCAIFYIIIAIGSSFTSVSPLGLFFVAANTLVGNIDMLLGLNVCGECVKACDAAGSVLKGLKMDLVLDSALERRIDVLCFQLAREKLRITICGLFDLDACTGPSMFKQIMMHIILLIQIAYNGLD